MNSVANAAFASWALNPPAVLAILAAAFFYLRGWLRIRQQTRDERDPAHLACFLSGLGVLFLATESPLDSFDTLFLSAHMTEHLLLMMIAPPLLLLARPVVPLLRGLPKPFVKEGLGPFLTWPALRSLLRRLTSPPIAFLLFAFSTIFWHLPRFYELALRSPACHGLQHASFFWTGILFWWPVIEPGPGKPHFPRWTAIPLLLAGDIVNTVLSAFFVFSGRILYPAYETVRASRMGAQEDQTIAGLLMWVPGSIVYLVPALLITVRLLSSQRFTRPPAVVRVDRRAPRRALALTKFRRPAQALMLLLAVAVMADGFFGTQIAPLSLAGVLPWIHWRALSLLALLIVGNLFCMACPFTFLRDLARKFLPACLRWPRALRSKWLSIGLLLLYLWAYEAFSLWNSPWLTACLIASYFLAALAIDGLFRGASFCKYVCPIGQFHFVTSLVSPREVRVRSTAVCQTCSTYDCIRGNQHSRGCELFLFQPKKSSSLDCTFCLDCVKACPHDNVSLLPVAPAATLTHDPYRSSIGRLSKRTDLAALALLIVFGAFVNAAGMTAPVLAWEHRLHAALGPHAMPFIVAAFILCGAVVLPALAVALCAALNHRGLDTARRFVFTLVPLGIAMWAAHLLFHFAIALRLPLAIPPTQTLLLDAGLL
ncbi:MAG TPA: cytochrome c oxidase assembly protein, partial [Acidobacteriaceae bacterium]|nr:cytochrome c oxidase assembly protein [Acidobacteriaceae bacterium]